MNKKTKEIQGKVSWISPKVGNFNGNSNVALKIEGQDSFFNKYSKDTKELQTIIDTIKKGYEIKITVDSFDVIQSIEVISDKIEESGGNWQDDMTNFKDLLASAHNRGLVRICTQHVEINLEKKYALFKAVVFMKPQEIVNGKKIEMEMQEFQAYGDAMAGNEEDLCNVQSKMIKPHFIRMAETRAIARALRWATNNASCSVEETEEGELPEK